ncbi:hypothetical protein N7462_000224 [Penicillium macrosclerotiorum]|uniref:uncharacterized protein n=1 Tax=Penicillium macrosclerotiorum TaxID=303699 RepID=UPI002546D93A|nr:uncharacterized protein N7462_000224 [Penicillium macrosclerotiorum]KAJ5698219.1 hypothetical protein N7462_000224 [Penicillium macrosclerotiorum]
MSSPTDSRSDAKEWSFGDGICPSASDFQQCYQESFEDWRQAARTSSQCLDPVLYLDHFLALLEKVPHYVHNLPEGIHLTGRQYALDISLRVQTTDCPDCDQRWKSIDYFQFLALPKPRIYKENKLSPQQQETDFAAQQSPYFSSIVLAWSYIISCRWAEILQASGLETIIRHSNSRSLTDSFWDIIIGHQWSAEVKSGSAPSYSPWMLRDEDIDPAQRRVTLPCCQFDQLTNPNFLVKIGTPSLQIPLWHSKSS